MVQDENPAHLGHLGHQSQIPSKITFRLLKIDLSWPKRPPEENIRHRARMRPSNQSEGHIGEWADPHVVLSAFRTLQEIAKFRRAQEQDVELKIFYADLTAYCAMIRSHASYITSGLRLNSNPTALIPRMVRLLEGVMTISFLVDLKGRSDNRLRALTKTWDDVKTGSDDKVKIHLLDDSLYFGGTIQRQEFIAALSSLEEEIRGSYAEEWSSSLADDLAPTRKTREPSYAVWKAAQSIFEALWGCKECECNPSHELCARLCLGTYRTSPSNNSDEDIDNEIYFNMLLSNGQELQHARVRSVRTTAVQWSVEVEASQKPRKPRPRPMRVKRICEPMIKMRTMASYRLELKVARNQLYKLQSVKDDLYLDKTKEPVSLRQLLGEGSRTFTERTRRILAVILSFAVLHLQDTNWLPPAWGSSNILFFPTTTSAIPLRPFIHISMTDPAPSPTNNKDDGCDDDGEDIDPDDLDPDDFVQHQCPNLVTLAIILMEVYFMTPFEFLVKRFGDDNGERAQSSGALRYIDALVVFQACKREMPENSQFHYAIDRCLDPTIWENEDGTSLGHDTLSSRIYNEVVLPLETELSQAYSSIPIEDLDRFAHGIDFTNWDQHIVQNILSNPPPMLSPDKSNVVYSVYSSGVTSPGPGAASPFLLSPSLLPPQLIEPLDPYTSPKFFDDEVASESHTPQA